MSEDWDLGNWPALSSRRPEEKVINYAEVTTKRL